MDGNMPEDLSKSGNMPEGQSESGNMPGDQSESGKLVVSNQISDDEGLSSQKSIFTGVVFGAIAVALFVFVFNSSFLVSPLETSSSYLHENFSSLKDKCYSQGEDFLRDIIVSIKEISDLDQPRTIIFLYNKKTETTMDKILHSVSNIAACKLSECLNKPVIIEGASLNKSRVINDYGIIISKYRHKLKKNGVMIVKNLEKVPGTSAQAFHSFCDDYTPVVKKALILFTMEVENLPEEDPMQFVREFLFNLWSDIGKGDKFDPLFARISSMILSVNSE